MFMCKNGLLRGQTVKLGVHGHRVNRGGARWPDNRHTHLAIVSTRP